MGCCPCCPQHAEEDDDKPDHAHPGPVIERKCTDTCCLAVLFISTFAFVALYWYLHDASSMDVLTHGHDHYRNMCGRGSEFLQDRKLVYYPDLQTDFKKDPTLRTHYGVCVSACPQQGVSIPDYDGTGGEQQRRPGKPWFVSLPTFAFIGRCIPYEPEPNMSSITNMCAYPACDKTRYEQRLPPTSPQQVCGLKRDGTQNYWLLSMPDVTLKEGWRTEGTDQHWDPATLETMITENENQAGSVSDEDLKSCDVVVERGLRITMKTTEGDHLLHQMLTKYTGFAFRWGAAVYNNYVLVFGFGIGGALLTSFLVICLLTIFARWIIIALVVSLFTVLIAVDYILFVQAGILTGNAGRQIYKKFVETTNTAVVPQEFEAMLDKTTDTEAMLNIYKYGAIILAIVIILLACAVMALWKKFEILIALLQEASKTVREMPSLLVFPFFGLISMVITNTMFLAMLVGLATTDATAVEALFSMWTSYVGPILSLLKLQGDDAFGQFRQTLMWIVVFGFLWAYFFHVAMFISIVAFAVSHWYFYRDDPERNAGTGIHSKGWFPGRPVLLATLRLCRYHIGSTAVGSFIMAVATMPRIIFEYINQQVGIEQNQVTKAIVWATRCVLWCLQKCLQFITEYAYVYVAVTGKPFCSAARSSFVLFAKYPVQVALDKMASTAIGYLVCVTVPLGMVTFSYMFVEGEWLPCGIAIAVLSYITTRLTVGVYDVCVTTLFVCSMRDHEHYGASYMSDDLRAAFGFSKQEGGQRQSNEQLPRKASLIEMS